MNSAFRKSVHGFLNSRSVSHCVDLRSVEGRHACFQFEPAFYPIGVISAARLGANIAAPPLMFQLVAAPTSTMATGSSGSLAVLACSRSTDCFTTAAWPNAGRYKKASEDAATKMNARVTISDDSKRCMLKP